ncbi:hypothetical protein GE061_006180 [Apolygus lucorum]|uniref:Uncharacterized protein n=1 Tax=Apolygus lucorum TaxID=248454 RepID=A0A6A4JAD4_APOLU|nr:hypothetical protein GE061_006180 [Apolygus lucorum]
MVMFSCNRCSKGLKKKDVLNHSFQCGGRNNINVTCIDCLKDFRGNEFDKHTSCVTEEARYGGKGVVVKETGKKQNQWLGIVREVLSVNKSLDVPVKKFLQSIQHMENIPRNQKKFHNWANSAMHIKDKSFLDQVFEILQTEFQKRNEAIKESAAEKTMDNSTEVVTEENGVNGEGGKKQKADDVQEELGNGEVNDKKRKKKKKSEKVDESVEEVERMEEETCQAPETKEDDVKLTKKEKKLKKKKAKFEAELQDIENFKKNEQDGEVAEEEAPKKKKSKKRKLAEENGVDKPDEDGEGKDSKRQKVEEDRLNEKGTEESAEPTAVSPSKKQKFDWFQMIVDVLKKSKHDEVPVKKVTKKVINEYIARYGDSGIQDKLNAKMTKKLRTCPNIRVLKDKVKLLETEE